MRKTLWFLIVFVSLLFISACSSENDLNFGDTPEDSEQIILTANDVPERKIIYTVESAYDVNDLNQSISILRNLIQSDEWFDLEDIRSSYATFTIRIRTDRLDDFTDELQSNFQVRSFSKQGRDISLQYQDKTNKITSLNIQITRLQELYTDATLTDMIMINQQLSNLEVELMNLEGELNLFDSLVEYSEVNVTLYGSTVVTRSPFFNRLANGFVNGGKAVITVLDGLAVAFVYMVPFMLILGPIGYGIYFFRKKHIIKKKSKQIKGE